MKRQATWNDASTANPMGGVSHESGTHKVQNSGDAHNANHANPSHRTATSNLHMRARRLFFGGAAALSLILATDGSALAATETNTTFIARYEHRAQVEAQLMALASTSPGWPATATSASSPAAPSAAGAISVASQAVADLNVEVSSLYTLDEQMVSTSAPVSQVVATVRSALVSSKSNLQSTLQAFNRLPKPKGKTNADRRKAYIAAAFSVRAQLRDVNQTMAGLNGIMRRRPFHRAPVAQLGVVQTAIERLQSATIGLLNGWLDVANPNWDDGRPTSIRNLAYTFPTVVVPKTASQPAIDTVSVQPDVVNNAGLHLPDMGTYAIFGPYGSGKTAKQISSNIGLSGNAGISIDEWTGTITVLPSATPGQYTVSYTQRKLTESVTLLVLAGNSSS